jgi:hypothetical protein
LLPSRDGFAPGQLYNVDLVSYNGKALIGADNLSDDEAAKLASSVTTPKVSEFSV